MRSQMWEAYYCVAMHTGRCRDGGTSLAFRKVIIKGRLDFEILYAVEGSGRMKNLSGALTFEENVSYPGLEPVIMCAAAQR